MRQKLQIFPTKTQKVDERGFSLLVTLLMMVLLSILALGLLSLSSISLRTATQGAAQVTARANARLALALAIGQLQQTMGPDTRVSAPASQLNGGTIANPDWVGVYSTRTKDAEEPIVGRNNGASGSDLNWTTDARVGKPDWRTLEIVGSFLRGSSCASC